MVKALLSAKGLDFSDVKAFDVDAYKQSQYDILADGLREALDMDLIYSLIK